MPKKIADIPTHKWTGLCIWSVWANSQWFVWLNEANLGKQGKLVEFSHQCRLAEQPVWQCGGAEREICQQRFRC